MKSNIFIKTCNITAAMILVFFLAVATVTTVIGEDKSMTAEELRKAAAAKAAALIKAPPGGKWKATAEEALEALKLSGDPEEGQEIYDVCAACHFPTGWGDPLGVFPQLAGQHTTVLIKQISDIRAKNRDNPTMYPFAMQIEGAQDIVDVCAYIQTRKMNPNPRIGPGGPSWILSNMRKEVWPISLDKIQQKVGNANFKKLKSLEEKEFKSKKEFQDALAKAIGAEELKKHEAVILENADWVNDLKIGKKLYEENCVRCHGDHGQGNWKQPVEVKEGQTAETDKTKMEPGYFPVIAGQTYLYLIRQFSWIQIGKRRNANPDMVKQIKNFTFRDMKSVVDYASRFKMQEGDWQEVGDKDEAGWDLGEEEEDDDTPAHLKD
ncbi:c-type cytochrome [Desulfococcaceae bacterium HSG7]|nr:c-type cytochrome [Desulfococcaceae bacterium HSG9]MDM8554405.1 c-type cytochrome [Desulfococcaceae bacterium HSG7]